MSVPAIERRTDPRRGVALRVGLTLAATGIASAAIDRRSLAGVAADVPLAVGFGLFIAILLLATLRRPPRGSTWLALASLSIVYLLAAAELATGLVGMISYLLLALGATLVSAPHLRPLMIAAFALWTPALWLFGPVAALDQVPVALRVAAVAALAFTVVAVADPRRTHPADRLRHIGYGLLAISCVAASIGRSLVVASVSVTPGQMLALIVAIGLPLLSYVRMRPASRETIATGLALATLAFVGLAYIVGKPYHTDVVAAEHHAAALLVEGKNPYASFDLPQALARFHLDPELATHLDDGSVVHTYNYPAVSFLVIAPFVWLGGDDIRWFYLMEVLLLAVIAVQQLRPAWRSMALATVIGSEIVTRQWILAGIDPSWALFTLGAWLLRRHRWSSAILLGLAVGDRQPAWFVAPFFLLAIFQRFGRDEAVRRAAIALGVAVAVNLPFVIGAPDRAIGSILAPLFAPLVSDGVGLMRYGADGVVPLFPRTVYTAVSLIAVFGLFILLWRRPRDLAGAPLAWPFLPLYFAWRSLQNYFASAPLFALVSDEDLENDREEPRPPDPSA